MDIKDWLDMAGVLMASFIVMIGWIIGKYTEESHERFRTRINRREVLLEAFLEVFESLQKTQGNTIKDPHHTDKWLRLANLMKMYGTEEEENSWISFAEAYLEKKDLELANRRLNSLRDEMISSVRKDLGFTQKKSYSR